MKGINNVDNAATFNVYLIYNIEHICLRDDIYDILA